MPVRGPKPKAQRRHRNPSPHDWTEVPAVLFEDAPPLPPHPGRPGAQKALAPPRPLDEEGRRLWCRVHRESPVGPIQQVALLQLCEQVDERDALRARVLADEEWRQRAALRALDGQIAAGLAALAKAAARTPRTWPAATRRWWRAVSRLPHCALWTEGDWQFAADTALIAAAFHAGQLSLAAELRARERIMGVTADARRDLRIRYVPAVDAVDPETDRSVLAMDAYRRSMGEPVDEN